VTEKECVCMCVYIYICMDGLIYIHIFVCFKDMALVFHNVCEIFHAYISIYKLAKTNMTL